MRAAGCRFSLSCFSANGTRHEVRLHRRRWGAPGGGGMRAPSIVITAKERRADALDRVEDAVAVAEDVAAVAIEVIANRIAGDGSSDGVALAGVLDHATAPCVAAIGLRRGMKPGVVPAILR